VDSPTTEALTTDQLIEACLRGDRLAWDTVVQRHWRRVFNIAYKFVGRHEEAEDLTQEIFLKLYKALKTFDRRANFQTWLVSISRNLCIDHYRSVRRERELVDRSVDAADLSLAAKGPDALSRLQRLDRRELLRRGMLGLPETLRTAVLLRDIQDLSYHEIARRLGLPEGTVKSRISRGRGELARQVAKHERATASSLKRKAGDGTEPTTPRGAQE
jgi:RNA polymerase sigma-70 factor (ECF subfamily)